jgi:NADH-quinone oxidoreductase subunit L
MLCRVFFLLDVPGSSALPVIACVGGFTALLAALIAIQQNDIKRILAYSTLSQLGYMVMAVGLSGPAEAMYHLTTHAFFKALLFLAAGSIILALHHEQDIWNMGGLRRKMPVTFWTFMAGTFALAGVPPFSGFFSKDSILAQALQNPNPLLKYGLFTLGVVVAALTVFYMFRLVFVVFQGEPKSGQAGHAHESPPVITWPLRVLAVFSTIAGVIGIEGLYSRQFSPEESFPAQTWWQQLAFPFVHSPWAVAFGLFAAVVGFGAAYTLYFRGTSDPLPARWGKWSRAMRNRFYFDEIYEGTFVRIHETIASFAAGFDRWIISGLLVRGTHGTTELIGRTLRLFQTGNLQGYALMFALGVALLLALNFLFGR